MFQYITRKQTVIHTAVYQPETNSRIDLPVYQLETNNNRFTGLSTQR
jgi:hypothetical protein